MNPTLYKAALIDLDGTLVDSIPDLAMAANAMREELGMDELPLDLLSHYVGKGMDNLITRILAGQLDAPEPDTQLFEQAKQAFKRHYHQLNGVHSQVYPGVVAGLQRLQAMGLQLAVVTNKPHEFTLPLLERTDLYKYFDVVVSGDTCPEKKPHPLPLFYACQELDIHESEAFFIGDSLNDAQAAQAAQMPVLILPYGYNEGRPVEDLQVNAIIDTIIEASDWLIKQQPQDLTQD